MIYGSYCYTLFATACLFRWSLTDTVITSELQLFFKFLEIQTENCENVQLCTIKEERNDTLDVKDRYCCRPCSCEVHCEQYDTCCPDFWLRDVIGDVKYKSIAELRKGIQRLELPQKQSSSKLLEDYECVSSRLIARSNRYGFREVDRAYFMTSRCPHSYANDVIKSGCEDVSKIRTTLMDELIPVTSASTNRTYRNIFCLSCNEGMSTGVIPWKSQLTCSYKTVLQDFIRPPRRLFQGIASKMFTFCNIVFNPPAEINQSVQVCKQADVRSCQKSFINDTVLDNTTATIYEQICSSYDLPVLITQFETYTIYKNIACVLCTNKSLPEKCDNIYPSYTEYKLDINIPSVTLNDTSPSELRDSFLDYNPANTFLDHNLDDTSFDYNPGNRCDAGFIFDENSAVCRQIVCPRHFYIHDGLCVPVISHVESVFYSITLEVKPNIQNNMTTSTRQEYENELESFLEKTASIAFTGVQIDIWRNVKDKVLRSNVVMIKFKNSERTYFDSIKKIQFLLSKLDGTKLQIGSKTTDIKVDIAGNMYEIKHQREAVERATKLKLHRVRVSDNTWDETEFKLSKGHFCYRLELNNSEIKRFGKYGIKVLSTGVRVDGAYFDVTDEGNNLACIDDVIKKPKDQTKNDEVLETKSIQEIFPDVTVIIIFGALFGLCALVVIVRLVVSCCRNQIT